jgi:hypothetical protein
MSIVNLLPDADGDVQEWIPSDDVPHWTLVDDPVGSPDEDATYVYTKTIEKIEDFNHETSDLLIGVNISNVRLLMRARKTNALDLVGVDPGLKIAGTRYPLGVTEPVTTSYADYTADWAYDPSGPPNTPWTKAVIDDLQSSTQSALAPSKTAELRCTQVYLIVTYTPKVTPVAGKGLVSWTP